eukprot:238249-Lingulodinium_polyedra.AAC.1
MAPCAVFSLLHALRIGAGAGLQRACGSRERACTLPRVRGNFGPPAPPRPHAFACGVPGVRQRIHA